MRLQHWLAFIGLGLAWGSSFLWIKIAVQEIGPFLLVALRLLVGAAGLGLVAVVARPPWPSARQNWRALMLLGITNTAIPFVLISWGEQFIDSAVAAILNSTMPLFTMVIAHFALLDDRLTWARLGGLLTGFVGVVLIVSRDLQAGADGSLAGQAAVMLAALFYAGSTVFARRNTKGLSPIVLALVPMLVADATLWLVTPAVENPLALPRLGLTWLALLWLGLIGSCLAYLLYYFLLHSVGPTRTSLVTYVFPLVGVALGVIFLSEALTWQLAAGGSLVVGGVAIVNRSA